MLRLRDLLQRQQPETAGLILITGNQSESELIPVFIRSLTQHTLETVEISDYSRYLLRADGSYGQDITRLVRFPFAQRRTLYLLEWRMPRRFPHTTLGENWLGTIVKFNSSKPEEFREVRSLVESLHPLPRPFILVAIPRKPENVWSFEDLRLALGLEQSDILMECDCTQYQSTKDVISTLAESLPETEFARYLREALTKE